MLLAKRTQEPTSSDSKASEVENLYESIVNQNLTGKSFLLKEPNSKSEADDGEKSGLGTVKFLMPDKFLISIKSNAGIEVARIFLTGDSIYD